MIKASELKNKVLFTCNDTCMKYDNLFEYIRDKDYTSRGEHCDFFVESVVTPDNKNGVLITFEATAGNEDWKNNFKFIPFPTLAYKGHENHLWFHYGFYKEYQSIRDTAISEIRERVTSKETPIFVSGWSLGGALSQICSEDIFYYFSIKPTMITYEAPRACMGINTRNFVRSCMSDDSVMFTYGSDIVPYVPPIFVGGHRIKDIECHLSPNFNIFTSYKTGYYHTHVNEAIREQCIN